MSRARSVAALECVAAVLQDYAARGVLQGLHGPQGGQRRARFELLWFRGRRFELRFDSDAGRLGLSPVLEGVAPRSAMDRDLRRWLASLQDGSRPAHRGLDPRRARLRLRNRGGSLDLYLNSLDGDWDYATRRLINLVNELYLDFLASGEHYDWLVETFELDPDQPSWP